MSTSSKFTTTTWLIIVIASIGFLFDTYELLMTPLVAAPAIAELLKVPLNNPMVTDWVGKLLWIAALCGGVFGLLGGWLVDRFGRKKIMAASIFLYSLSPFCAAFATTLPMFVFFRSTTFIGVCVEFVAAITWLAEVFPDKKDKEKWLGITQAFASLGGLLVTGVSVWISKHGADLPHWGLPLGLGATDPVRKEMIGKIKANFGQQKPLNDKVKAMSDKVQLHQELGGLVGRIILAVLLIWGISRVALLKIFQIPALVLLPLTYFKLFEQGGQAFLWAYGVCGLLTVAQFSYFGEYLPKVFPMHLRGTGGSFATNVGGRMIGTSMAFLTTSFVAPMIAGKGPMLPMHVAMAAGYVGTGIAVISFIVGFLLPEPKSED
jgi:MFS family permease